MVNAQEWFEENYPKGKRGQVIELNIWNWNKKLEGKLDIFDFTNLENIRCGYSKLTSLKISNCPQLERIDCSDNLLTSLELDNLRQLRKLRCCNNQLANLIINGCNNLVELNCENNRLTHLSSLLDSCDYNKIRELRLSNNKFLASNLTPFSRFINLEWLGISNNSFAGSLRPLQNLIKLEVLHIVDTDIDSGLEYLPESIVSGSFVCSNWPKETSGKVKNIVEQLTPYGDWCNNGWLKGWREKNRELIWKARGFFPGQIKRWIASGAEERDCEFIVWLRDSKKADVEWVLNNEKEFKDLRERYWSYGLCQKCQQPNNKYDWCQSCNCSGNPDVDQFIKKHQLKVNSKRESLTWIPHEQFSNVKFLARGGFGEVYRASWNDKKVALKSLHNSQNMTDDFFQEITYSKLVETNYRTVKCYGISQDPITKNYVMVMDYIEGGNLREYLKINRIKLGFENRLRQLIEIVHGIKRIHEKGLMHRDFHAGNILNNWDEYEPESYITDLGLCRPADASDDGKVYGVLPYVAPEVLRGEPHTQASDVYSLGIVAYELFSGLPPYAIYDKELVNYKEVAHDYRLALNVCEGLRPNLSKLVAPQLLKDLINRCWDADPLQRPKVSEINTILGKWTACQIYDYIREGTEFYHQYKKIEKIEKASEKKLYKKLFQKIFGKKTEEENYWKVRTELFLEFCKQHNCDENSEEAKESFERFLSAAFFLYHTHPQAIYTSRLLDFKNLPEPQNSQEINDQFWGSKDLELNLDKLDIQKGFQTESSAQINKVAGLTEQLSLFTETEQNNMFSLPQTEQELRQQKSVRLAKKEKELGDINYWLRSLFLECKNLKSRSRIKQLISINKKKKIEKKIFAHLSQVEKLTNEIAKLKEENQAYQIQISPKQN